MKKRFVKSKASFMALVIVLATFSVYLINPVSAEEKSCCEKTKSGESCLYTDASKCDLNVRSANTHATCDQTSYCQVGCCQDKFQGTCYKSTTLAKCNAMNGVFSPDASCSNLDCKKGCCVALGSCSYVNEKGCDNIFKDLNGVTKDFRDVASEAACSGICRGQDQGCCKSADNTCVFASRDSCSAEFNNGKYCSDISSCSCSKHYNKGCYDDDVYWFDSCGNREDKVEDCDYSSGTKCGKDVDGNYVCKGIDCELTYKDDKNVHDPNMGSFRKNGESWCVYESGVGDYLDRPGTRHFKHMCVNGEELVEPCRDFREEICVQGKVNDYTEAQCVRNNIYESKVTSNISTVPTGFKFWEDAGGCDSASRTCKVIYVKKNRFSSFKCVQNCECETQEYIDKMNKFCKSKGDCGSNLNILGVKSEAGLAVSGDGRSPSSISSSAWDTYSRYGVFGGMIFLSNAFDEFAEANVESPDGGLTESLIAGGVVGIGLTIAASLSTSFAGLLTSAGFTSLLPALAGMSVTVIGAVVVVIVMVITYVIFGGGETKTYYVTVSCMPWQAPDGGADCGKCRNENKLIGSGFDDCTEYKCKSLGKLCEFILENEGSSRVTCFSKAPLDVNSPVISPWPEALTSGYSLTPIDYGFSISPKIKPFTLMNFGIITDELSQCKISETHAKNFDGMSNYFGDNYFSKEHNITLNLVGGKDYTYSVRCKDASGNSNTREFTIKLSTEALPDVTPPVIDGFDPGDGSYVPSNLTQGTVNLLMNEPSVCKWSSQDKAYEDMEDTASCDLETHNEAFILNYDCYALLNISSGVNTYYFRCMDLNNNTNQESIPYSLVLSNPLGIVYSSPSGTLYDTNSPSLEITTAGGSQDGVSTCSFSTSDVAFESMIPFFETNSPNHRQNLMNLPKGDYVYHVKCRDPVGNEASTTLNFGIDSDTVFPQLFYIYSGGSALHLILNEPSTCEYSNSTFVYGSGIRMDGAGSYEQTAPADVPYYYINCVDKYNNTMPEIIVYL